MAISLSGIAYIVAVWIIPWGCYTRADAVSSLWGCVVPGVTIVSSLALMFVLPVCLFIGRRIAVPLSDRWYTIALGAAIASQIAVSSTGIIAATPMHAGLRLSDVIFVPHGFLIGFVCGILFWLLRLGVNHVRGRRTA